MEITPPVPGEIVQPGHGDDWLMLTTGVLPATAATDWAVLPGCGAVVSFLGTVRDHAEGRPGVTRLEYEAYTEEVEPRMAAIARAAREAWPTTGRIALLHRAGSLRVSDVSVVVVVSSPHRAEAFDAARYCIDTLKSTVPIWKRESWDRGEDWSGGAQPIEELKAFS